MATTHRKSDGKGLKFLQPGCLEKHALAFKVGHRAFLEGQLSSQRKSSRTGGSQHHPSRLGKREWPFSSIGSLMDNSVLLAKASLQSMGAAHVFERRGRELERERAARPAQGPLKKTGKGPAKVNVLDLPDNVLYLIGTHLNHEDAKVLAKTSRRLKEMMKVANELYHQFHTPNRHAGSPSKPPPLPKRHSGPGEGPATPSSPASSSLHRRMGGLELGSPAGTPGHRIESPLTRLDSYLFMTQTTPVHPLANMYGAASSSLLTPTYPASLPWGAAGPLPMGTPASNSTQRETRSQRRTRLQRLAASGHSTVNSRPNGARCLFPGNS